MATPSIAGKTVVVTGATSGIGKATATELARRGGQILILCRNESLGETTADTIAEETDAIRPKVYVADLSDFDAVRTAAAKIVAENPTIDVLINNAGVHALAETHTDAGFDFMLAANYLGPFLLTNLLLEAVKAAPQGRIVTVASEAHRNAGRLDGETFEEFGTYGRIGSFRRYGRSKGLDLVMAFELARRLDGDSTTSNAVCPGVVATNLLGGLGRTPLATRLSQTPVINTPAQGAVWPVRCASDPGMATVSGKFFSTTPGANRLPAMKYTTDRALAERIWERTERLVGLSPK